MVHNIRLFIDCEKPCRSILACAGWCKTLGFLVSVRSPADQFELALDGAKHKVTVRSNADRF